MFNITKPPASAFIMNQKASQKIILSFIFLFILLAVFFFFRTKDFSQFMPEGEPTVKINNKVIWVEVADSAVERQKGLMFRESLLVNNGMLFIFEEEQEIAFWMKNTLIPLDMLFIDKDLEIVYIEKGAQPCKADPCQTYPSSRPAKYVLEVNAGYTEIHGINIGDIVEINI